MEGDEIDIVDQDADDSESEQDSSPSSDVIPVQAHSALKRASESNAPTSSTSPSNSEQNVQVRFTTKLTQDILQPPSSTFMVPDKLARRGLSAVLNTLLHLETPQAFDFLIRDEFLRTSLAKYLRETNQKPDETVLEVEYLLALAAPKETNQNQHDDWIGCITEFKDLCFSGGYDGVIRAWDIGTLEIQTSFRAHKRPINSIIGCRSPKGEKGSASSLVISASMDHRIIIWDIHRSSAKNAKAGIRAEARAECVGHSAQVSCLSLSPSGNQFCSSSWDKTIKVWNVRPTEDRPLNDGEGEPKAKKAKSNASVIDQQALCTLSGHSGPVSCVVWKEDSCCISGGWDNSIRVWDVPSSISTSIIKSKKLISCLDSLKETQLILTGHHDNLIRLWDPRSKEGELVKRQFKSHKAWVSQVKWHPSNEKLFASTSYDGSVKVWDVRTAIPLHTIDAHSDKALCVLWKGNSKLLSGGADKLLKSFQLSLHS